MESGSVLKLIILGNSFVGKTSLIMRFVDDKFDDSVVNQRNDNNNGNETNNNTNADPNGANTSASGIGDSNIINNTGNSSENNHNDNDKESSNVNMYSNNEKYITKGSTIGIEYNTRVIQLNDKIYFIQIWDTAGQERYRSIIKSYYKGILGVFYVFDLTCRQSFNDINMWIDEVNMQRGDGKNIAKLLIGNKKDRINDRKITKEECINYANKLNMEYYETSILDSNSVDKIFDRMISLILDQHQKDQMLSSITTSTIFSRTITKSTNNTFITRTDSNSTNGRIVNRNFSNSYDNNNLHSRIILSNQSSSIEENPEPQQQQQIQQQHQQTQLQQQKRKVNHGQCHNICCLG